MQRNGQLLSSTPFADVARIEIRSGAGDDVIDCSTLTIPNFLDGGNGHDKVAGGDGDDTLSGGAHRDHLDGGIGNDRLNGNGGNDRLFGGPNGDRLFGYDGNDLLDGGSSIDRLEGGLGADTMFGVGGNDRFFAADSAIDDLFGGKGDDTAPSRRRRPPRQHRDDVARVCGGKSVVRPVIGVAVVVTVSAFPV